MVPTMVSFMISCRRVWSCEGVRVGSLVGVGGAFDAGVVGDGVVVIRTTSRDVDLSDRPKFLNDSVMLLVGLR